MATLAGYQEQGPRAHSEYMISLLGLLLSRSPRARSKKGSLRGAHLLWNLEAQELPAEDGHSLRLWELLGQWASRRPIYLQRKPQTRLHAEQRCVGGSFPYPGETGWSAGRNLIPEMIETSDPLGLCFSM